MYPGRHEEHVFSCEHWQLVEQGTQRCPLKKAAPVQVCATAILMRNPSKRTSGVGFRMFVIMFYLFCANKMFLLLIGSCKDEI